MGSVRRAFEGTVAGLPREFWWLWSGTLVNRAGAFVLPFLAIYLTRSLGYSTAFAGLVLGAVGLGSMGASIAAGVLADRWGRRPVLLWSQVATATRPAYSAMMADVVPVDYVSKAIAHISKQPDSLGKVCRVMSWRTRASVARPA